MINDFKQYILFYYKNMFTTNKPLKIPQIIKDFFFQKQKSPSNTYFISCFLAQKQRRKVSEGAFTFNNTLVSK